MTREQIAQQRKQLETAWKDLETTADELTATAHLGRQRLRAAFSALLTVDQFLISLELEGGAA